MPACLARQPHRVIAEARWRGSRCGGAVTHLSTTRSATAAAAPECSPWSPADRPAASGLRLLGFSVAGPADLPFLLKPLSFSAAGTPPTPPSSARCFCPLSFHTCPNPLARSPMLFLALLYPQAITTSLALNAICQQIK